MPNGIRHRPTITSTPKVRMSCEAHILHRLQRCQKGANFSTAAVGFLLRLPAQALPMWPPGSVDNPKKITHDVGPRSLQGEVELTSNRIDLPLCLAASYPPCSFNVACGGLVLLAAHSMSTMTPQRNWAFPVQDMLCNTGERTGRARSSPRTHTCHTWPARGYKCYRGRTDGW